MRAENPNWQFNPERPTPAYDEFADFCDRLNEGFAHFEESEIDPDIISMRRLLQQEPLPRIGWVYTQSDSKLYNMFSQMEGHGTQEIEANIKLAKFISEDAGELTTEDLIEEVGSVITHLQAELDSGNPVDVTVLVHHVYKKEFEQTLNQILRACEALNGSVLSHQELTPMQQTVVGIRHYGIPYNFSQGFVVRFEN